MMPISEDLLKSIKEDTFLKKELMLIGKSITHEELVKLLNCLASNTHIKHLYLSDNKIDDRGVELLLKFNLESLCLSGNLITDVGVKSLLKSSSIKRLFVGENAFLSEEAFEDIGENETLEHLNASSIGMTSKGAAFISKNKTIKTLVLDQNALDDASAPHFSSMLSLKILDLTTNMITDVGFQILYDSHIDEIDLIQNWNINGARRIGPERHQIKEEPKARKAPILAAFDRQRAMQRKRVADEQPINPVNPDAKRVKPVS